MRWVVVVALAAGLWPVAAHAGWRGTEWGMTPEQVAAALPGEAPVLRKPSRSMGKLVGNRGDYLDGKTKFRAAYYYDDKGLAVIGLDAPRKFNCVKLVEPLITAHGAPIVMSDQVLFRLVIWHDAPAANRIRLMVSPRAGICSLYYERLSDYEAYDKRPRDAGS